MTYADLTPGSTGFLVACLAGYLLLVNLLALFAFAVDRRRRIQGMARVPERTLLILATLGGWPGAKLGQWVLGHKAVRRSFGLLLNLCGLILPIAVAGTIAASKSDRIAGFAGELTEKFAPGGDGTAPEAAKKDLPHRFGPGADDPSHKTITLSTESSG